MPAWLIPALKAVLPHLGTIVSATSPAFTRKSASSDELELLHQQIMELQAAATANDAHIKEVAREIKSAIERLEDAAAIAESRYRRMLWLAMAALVTGLTALACTVFVLLAR